MIDFIYKCRIFTNMLINRLKKRVYKKNQQSLLKKVKKLLINGEIFFFMAMLQHNIEFVI